MKITIITLGKLKESYWKAAEKEYLKRLSVYAKLAITEIKEIPFSHISQTDAVRKKEAKELQKHIPISIGILASGNGTSVEKLLKERHQDIKIIITNKTTAGILPIILGTLSTNLGSSLSGIYKVSILSKYQILM